MTAATPSDWQETRRIVRDAGSSFYWPMRVLPQQQRDAMFALYALCRLLDDIADDDGLPKADRLARLDDWKSEIRVLYEGGTPSHPVSRCLAEAIAGYRLPRIEFEELIAGMVMDATAPIVAPEDKILTLYCRRVAGTVGQLSLHVFGRTDDHAVRFGLCLAEALQLTNILRDIWEDAGRGRLYLPAELLAAQRVPTDDPRKALADPNLPAVCEALSERARARFAEADDHLTRGGRKGLAPALIMMALYRRLLRRLGERGWSRLTPRLRLSKPEKAALILRQLLPFAR